MIGGGFHQDGVVIEMITLEVGETSMAEIQMEEAVAMVERRGDFSSRTRDNGGRNIETGQRVYQNGGGRAKRESFTEAQTRV
jgi:hypothetical protein